MVNVQIDFMDSSLKCNHEGGKDKFKGMRHESEGFVQVTYGEEIGLGSSNYKLIRI